MHLWCYHSSQLIFFSHPDGFPVCCPGTAGVWGVNNTPARSVTPQCHVSLLWMWLERGTRHSQAPWPSRGTRLAPCAPVLCWNGAGKAPCAPNKVVPWPCLWLQTHCQGGKCPSYIFFKGDFAAKSITWEMKVARRGGSVLSLFPFMRSGNCCFAFFSLRNILPFPRCTLKKRAKAVARQGRSSRHTARNGKPCWSQGRPLAMSLRSIVPRH